MNLVKYLLNKKIFKSNFIIINNANYLLYPQ